MNDSVAVCSVFTSNCARQEWLWSVACPGLGSLARIVASLRWMLVWLRAWVTRAEFASLHWMVNPAATTGSYPRLRWLVSSPLLNLTWRVRSSVLMSPPWRSCPSLGYLFCKPAALFGRRAGILCPAFGISGLCRASNVECRRSALALLAAQAQS